MDRHNPDVVARLPLFVQAIQAATDLYFATHLKSLKPDVVEAPVLVNTRYARIIKLGGDHEPYLGGRSKSVWGFVDLSNGDILKAAGWKGPAKHARGNILKEDFDAANWTLYGPHYL